MAAGDLRQADFDIAFSFSRSAAAGYVGGNGFPAAAAIDAPRFDHDETGTARGLLITPGADIGEQDRAKIDPLMLPAALIEGPASSDRAATVFHAFVPLGADPWVVERRAWYSRNVQATLDRLLSQSGHHIALGVIAGFRSADAGVVRLRGQTWALAGILLDQAGGVAVAIDAGGVLPLVTAGAELV